jgi:hypothetical protein
MKGERSSEEEEKSSKQKAMKSAPSHIPMANKVHHPPDKMHQLGDEL